MWTLEEILDALAPRFITGLSILGGDPFEPENAVEVFEVCRMAKAVYPDKTIWVYTGYLYEDLKDFPIMDYIDVLVDGPFIEAQKDLSLAFRGSRNQRIIDVKATRSSGTLTLLERI
jgi:anaerobic ribonucleoside-triphosphate reductase activating protein